MSQFILDEQLAVNEVLDPLRKRLKVQRLVELRPGERILDDRIPEILRTLTKPTFITLDSGFWRMDLCHAGYSIFTFRAKWHLTCPAKRDSPAIADMEATYWSPNPTFKQSSNLCSSDGDRLPSTWATVSE